MKQRISSRFILEPTVQILTPLNGTNSVTNGHVNELTDGSALTGGTGTDHSHPNKPLLDALGIDGDNILLVNSIQTAIPLIDEEW